MMNLEVPGRINKDTVAARESLGWKLHKYFGRVLYKAYMNCSQYSGMVIRLKRIINNNMVRKRVDGMNVRYFETKFVALCAEPGLLCAGFTTNSNEFQTSPKEIVTTVR